MRSSEGTDAVSYTHLGNGIAYRCVERRGELAEAIAEMQACRGAYLLEVRVESEDNVFPMVPAGAPVAAIRLE